MLQDIRDNSQGVVAKVIIGLIVAVFALWGVESLIGGFISSPSVAEVNGEEITEQQLTISTQNLLASIGGNVEGFDQGLLEQIALTQLIEEVLLRQAAESYCGAADALECVSEIFTFSHDEEGRINSAAKIEQAAGLLAKARDAEVQAMAFLTNITKIQERGPREAFP